MHSLYIVYLHRYVMMLRLFHCDDLIWGNSLRFGQFIHRNVYFSIIYNNEKFEITLMTNDRVFVKQIMVYLYTDVAIRNGVLGNYLMTWKTI